MDNYLWYVDGFTGFYQGFYSDLYRASAPACFDEEAREDMARVISIIENPWNLLQPGNLSGDTSVINEVIKVMGVFNDCHITGTFFDIFGFCTQDIGACRPAKLISNVSDQYMILVGKFAEFADIIKHFPADDETEFENQMTEIGSEAGTILRTLIDFK